MVKLENIHWNEIEHYQFVFPYAGYLVLHSLSQEEFSELDQHLAASSLTESASTSVREVIVDADSDLDRAIFTLRFEADSDLDAMRMLSLSALEAWASIGRDPGDLEFVAAHLIHEPDLISAQSNAGIDIDDPDFLADRLDLVSMDEDGILHQYEPSEIFYKARNAN